MNSLLAAGFLAMASLAAPHHPASSSLVVHRGPLEISLSATGTLDMAGATPLAAPSSAVVSSATSSQVTLPLSGGPSN